MKRKKNKKPGAPKKEQQLTTGGGGLLPGLGGDPWGAAPVPGTRMDMERMSRAITKLMSEQEFESDEEADAFMASLMGPGRLDDILAQFESDPAEEAQDLAFQAQQVETDEEALALCEQALKLDPGCIDALLIKATLEAPSDRVHASLLRVIIRDAEARFGEAFMRENRGHFWGFVETRPYMRARECLVAVLTVLGEVEAAIAECEAMLDLNPGDNQGIRDRLRGLYLQADNTEGVRRLAKEYPDSMLAVPQWAKVLERWISGDLKTAAKTARTAHKQNRHFVPFILGKKRIPDSSPGYYAPGDVTEAIHCVEMLGHAWLEHPEAMVWLDGLKLK